MEVRLDGTTKLEELEQRKTALFEELAKVGEEQKRLAREVYAVEKEQREQLKGIPEYVVDGELSHEEVERWTQTVYFSFARTNPGNPHMYAARKRCDDAMFEKVAGWVQRNGYTQHYGGDPYTVYDVELHGVSHFIWTMGSPLPDTVVLNAKPDSMRPQGG
jgi:hypothetical protein